MANRILNCTAPEQSTWLPSPTRSDGHWREHDHVTLFEMGAHPFLTLTLFIAMFERDHGPLEYQKAYGRAMEHIRCPTPTSPPDGKGAHPRCRPAPCPSAVGGAIADVRLCTSAQIDRPKQRARTAANDPDWSTW